MHAVVLRPRLGGSLPCMSSYSILGMGPPAQVSRSVEYVQSGTTALQDAKTLQKKTRKWMCCAIILLLVTAAVIVIVVSCQSEAESAVVLCARPSHPIPG